ncbi:ATP-binding cassette domain-containing protein [Bacillus sp. V2I10]|uniref:ATP-binding cassette domain-containing protein n=1 Tax=Bacillus sp. V2I10 TaxID=3042276 RepID=UPI00278590DC|nr:ATP-binding cassette domain-containing protein [Bacillus sp. V2I10]MDQ0857942.1 ABC-type multidrug transport system ATPase subunit [Bacillus sp. V2I10]
MLEVKNVSKSYQSTIVLKDISFHMARGECLGLIGGSGSGKSTLAKLILGIAQCDEGEVIINGTDFSVFKKR